MQTYGLLLSQAAATNAEAVRQDAVRSGEKDEHRLRVCGLAYLRQLDGSSDPMKAGFAGL